MITCTIHNAANGCIVTVKDEESGDMEIVYQEQDGNEVEGFAEFLRYICDHYGPSTSRYSKKRIYITVSPGDKYENNNED